MLDGDSTELLSMSGANDESWKDDLRMFFEIIQPHAPAGEQNREQYGRVLERTLADQVYPAFEEFLSEMTSHGIGGQLYGRDTGYAITLRLDDGFEVAVQRDRHREQSQLLPGLIFVRYVEKDGRYYLKTDGISWDRIKKPEILANLVEEYKHWHVVRLLART